jgi:type IV secretion system protein VirB9
MKWLLLATLLLTGSVSAEVIPLKGVADARIRTAAYNGEDVYRLIGFVGYAIELIFEDGETYSGRGGGDLEGVTVDAHANSVLLKPAAAVVATNLVIYTDRRAYRFEYTVIDRRPNRFADDLVFALRFTYPAPPHAPSLTQELEIARAAVPRNLNYRYCGHPSLKPIAASDDGIHTRIRFKPNAEIPAIFVRHDDGSESLLNYSMLDGDVLIHRLAPRFILRRGKLTGCIVNQAYTGTGQRLPGGTVSPNVERELKAVHP